MLDNVDLSIKLAKDEYKDEKDRLVSKLTQLQQRAHNVGLGSIVIFEGWDAAGKGSRISDLVANLDPRTFNVWVIDDPVGDEERKPLMERFWRKTGAHGTMTIFDRSYYSRIAYLLAESKPKKRAKRMRQELGLAGDLVDMPYGGTVGREQRALITSTSSYEKQFADDGYVIVKFFLHIAKGEQTKRLERLTSDKNTAWRVNKHDLAHNKNYDALYQIMDAILERTNYSYAPWRVVSAMDSRSANITIMRTLVDALERGLARKSNLDARDSNKLVEASKKATADNLISTFALVKVPTLDDVSYDNTITNEEYQIQLKTQQKKLDHYHDILRSKHIPLMLAYEGWDAAGKGGSIKRVCRAIDARGYRVIPSASPSWEEKHHPFLWRYWINLPKNGHIAIYDRTWYGRVLVERVEGFATADEWQRAYDEINEFEWELQQWGAILLKFWIDVSQDEQLRRFKDRQNNPAKRWKITDEDWRNREKYPQYKIAAQDMMRLTSTAYAPWQIIESDSKYFARVKVLKLINKAIEQRLKG